MFQDIKAMLWKEYAQFRKNTTNEIGVAVLLALAIGVGVPLLFLKDPGMSGTVVFNAALAGLLIYATYFFAMLSSDGAFGEEIQSGALRMLLVTRLRPTAIFAAKWLAVMIRTIALIVAATALQAATVRLRTGSLEGIDARWIAWGIGISMLAAAYAAAVNGAVSLVAKSAAQLRQLGMLGSFIPLLGLVGFGYLIGWGRGAIVFVSALLFVLTVASFFIAVLVFRSEKTRC